MLAAKESYGYGKGHRRLEIAGIVVFFASMAILAGRMGMAIQQPRHVALLLLCALLGFVTADFLSGMAHWAGDTLGTEATPFVGPSFIAPFRLHHVDQKAITRHDFIETNGNNCLAAMPAMLAMAIFMPSHTGIFFYAGATLMFTAWFVFCSNQFHKWAHAGQTSRAVRALQRWHLILEPHHHSVHHTPPHDKYYCITVGWLNPLLAKIGFFRACERAIAMFAPGFLYLKEREAEVRHDAVV